MDSDALSTRNVAIVIVGVVLVVASICAALVLGVTNGQRTTRQIQIACIQEHGSWISGHCLYPVGNR